MSNQIINIQGNIQKQKTRESLQRKWIILQKRLENKMRPILKRQYADAAKNIDSYQLDFNFALLKYNKQLNEILVKHYKTVASEFGEKMLEDVQKSFLRYERKGLMDDFWRFAIAWITGQVANKVRRIQKTTILSIQRIVKNGFNDGKTNQEIAKQIKATGAIATVFRARKIARTETHSAVNYSMESAMKESGLVQEKEWVSALDDRTRRGDFNHVAANGERVDIKDTFKKTGENLKFPGDPDGSAGNIINCRCVSLFHTERKVS